MPSKRRSVLLVVSWVTGLLLINKLHSICLGSYFVLLKADSDSGPGEINLSNDYTELPYMNKDMWLGEASFETMTTDSLGLASTTIKSKNNSRHAFEKTNIENKNIESHKTHESERIFPNTSIYDSNNVTQSTDVRYLFPVHFCAGCPNYQYNNYRIALRYAISLNRSIVAIDFADHFAKHITKYKGLHSLESTFDVDELRKIVTIVTVDEYKRACHSSFDALVMERSRLRSANKYMDEYVKTISMFRYHYGIELPRSPIISRTREEYMRMYKESSSVRCLGIFRPWDIDDNRLPDREEIYRNIDIHLKWAPYIRQMGEQVASTLCNGKPYLAVHWRNRTGEPCRIVPNWQGHVAYGSNRKCLNNIKYLSELIELAKGLSKDVHDVMREHSLSCVYVSCPFYSVKILEILKATDVPVIWSLDKITTHAYPAIRAFKDDNYVMSLVEQEICKRSEVFIQRSESNWSEMVRYTRKANHDVTLTMKKLPWYKKAADGLS